MADKCQSKNARHQMYPNPPNMFIMIYYLMQNENYTESPKKCNLEYNG